MFESQQGPFSYATRPHAGGVPTSGGLTPSPEAIQLVSKRLAYGANILPLKLEDRKLICATYDPINFDQVAYFQAQVCREVTIISASKEEVELGLAAAYGTEYFPESEDLVDAVTARSKPIRRNTELMETSRKNDGAMKVIAVASGKGGVGKSSMTSNIAIALARQGYRVGLIDCDFGLSNLHVMLGAKPKYNLSDVMHGRIDALSAFELVTGGLYLLAGSAGAAEFADLNYQTLQKDGAGFSTLNSAFDYLLLDTAAGIHDGVLSLLLAADETLLVMTPDPASILDAYVAARALVERRPNATIKCLVNQATSETDAKLIFAKFTTFIGLNTSGHAEFLGKVMADKAASEAARTRVPFMISAPNSQVSRDVDAIACKLANVPQQSHLQAGFFGRLFGGLKAA